MKLLATGFLFLGLVILIFCYFYDYSWLDRREPFFTIRPRGNSIISPDMDFWIYPGDTERIFEKKRKSEYASIQGLAYLSNLKVDIIVLEPTGTTVENSSPFRVYENIPIKSSKPDGKWSETILTKGKATTSDIKEDLEIEVKSIPNDEDLWGRNAKAVITGNYVYPTTSGDKGFTEITSPKFREEVPFRFATRAEKEKYESAYTQYEQEKAKVDLYNRRAGWFYFFTRLFGFLLSIGLIGISIWIFIRSKRQKLKAT